MKAKIKALMVEKDKMRGMVPSRVYGNRDRVYGAYLNTLNPRENPHIQEALATHKDPRFQEFLNRITENRYKKVGLQTIAKACGIDLSEFSNWWNRESTQRAIAVAQLSSVAITEDMAEDAKSVHTTCERCDGMTFVTAPAGLPKDTPGYKAIIQGEETVWIRTCPNCQKGKIRRPGDTHARDKLLEISGLVKKGGGVQVNVNNFGGATHASAVQDLDDAMCIDV